MPASACTSPAPRGPFFNREGAAAFCGYKLSSFVDILRNYEIPRCGPNRSKFARETLEEFMAAPELFKRGRSTGSSLAKKPVPLTIV